MFDSPITNWIIVGLILSLLELIVPGVYLIWFGLAALLMSAIMYFFPIGLAAQLIWFAIFSAIFALFGLYVYDYIFKKTQTPKEYQNLNNTAEQLIGHFVTLSEDVTDNQTKVKIGDTFWLAYCEKPLHSGDKAKIIGVKDAMILVIE